MGMIEAIPWIQSQSDFQFVCLPIAIIIQDLAAVTNGGGLAPAPAVAATSTPNS